jgi:LPS-assembly protein
VATQTFLPADASLTYSSGFGGQWSVTGRAQTWQTLQDPQNPVTEPYNRVPQLSGAYLKQVVGGFDAGIQGEYVQFDTNQSGLPTGRRAIAYPSLSLPLLRPEGFLTPKIGYHYTNYSLNELSDPLVPSSQTRGLPITSVDGGLVYERDTVMFGRDLVQTLEPRAYYLYVPYRNQSNIPLFDTSIADLNSSQIFSDNYYSGSDRISDANQLTLAATSRLILPSTGQEVLRGFFGQIYYFESQRVALNSTTPTRAGPTSPFILGLAGRVAENWIADMTVQYAFSDKDTEDGLQRANLGVRYSPEYAKVFNVSYRYTAPGIGNVTEEIRQIDVSAQWPLGAGFSAVGRYNFDLVGGQATEVLGGVEYNAGCSIVRVVGQSFVTATDTRSTSLFIQLELNGFSRFGSNPTEALRRNIPGYTTVGRSYTGQRPFALDPVGDGSVGAPLPYGGVSTVPYDN